MMAMNAKAISGIKITKKMKKMKKLFIITLGISLFASCTSIHKTTKQPVSHVQISMDDFNLSAQVTARAKSITIVGIDFERIFMRKTGSIGGTAASLPIVGQYLADPTSSYAMYNLLAKNESADFVFYPQIEKKTQCPILGICYLTKITSVDVKARVGTFK